MGKQLNFYRSTALQAELEAEALWHTKRARGAREFTAQDMLRLAWDIRPANLRESAPAKKGGAK
jgi:hypothetical protein